MLKGGEIGPDLLKRAGEAAAVQPDIESDSRGSEDYKRHLLKVHLGRAIEAMAAE